MSKVEVRKQKFKPGDKVILSDDGVSELMTYVRSRREAEIFLGVLTVKEVEPAETEDGIEQEIRLRERPLNKFIIHSWDVVPANLNAKV